MEGFYKFSKDMKYLALYWALGFQEEDENIFVKSYYGYKVCINAEEQYIDLGNQITVINFPSKKFELKTHKSFVVLECIDRLLTMGYEPFEIIIDGNNEYDIYAFNVYIKCFEWDHLECFKIDTSKCKFYSVIYSSRLISGVIERITKISFNNKIFDYGIFDSIKSRKIYNLYNKVDIKGTSDFIIKGDSLIKYVGSSKKVIVPKGIKELGPCAFWDNQNIEVVVLPDSLINLGGDTFYNCRNLRYVSIPKNVSRMGNNPFAGCPILKLENKSRNFKYQHGALFTKDKKRLIYYSIIKKDSEYKVPFNTLIIGKHAFFLCNNLKKIVLPKRLIKLENNPFSGCDKLEIENKSNSYHIVDKVIYNKFKTSVIGCLNSIETDYLKLLPVKSISRNSFWNCKGIKTIEFPNTLEQIGYNPFVSCSNIEFKSLSNNFVVKDGMLFNKDMTKLICCPSKIAIGDVHIPDSVITLERGAFSGCDKMTSINLHNVSIISKTCFTNCDSLKKVYCSDLVSYIGEWAFAHCKQLKEVSLYKDCYVDKNVILNSPTKIIRRESRSNYLIESENLHTLKSMLNNYKNKIDSIIIDPPYNSHIDYIEYKDSDFKGSYINFIKERLEISKNLLSDDGYLVINIDEGEYKNIYNICKKLFKFVEIYKWEKLHDFFDKNRDVNPNKKKVLYEYIVIASKNEFNFNKIKQPYIKNNKLLEKWSDVPKIFSCFGTTSSAKDELKKVFGRRDAFSTPKPIKLIQELIRATTKKDSIVLDYFAGSGTTGVATNLLNLDDDGKRNYILITNNESNICEQITKKRLDNNGCNYIFLR